MPSMRPIERGATCGTIRMPGAVARSMRSNESRHMSGYWRACVRPTLTGRPLARAIASMSGRSRSKPSAASPAAPYGTS